MEFFIGYALGFITMFAPYYSVKRKYQKLTDRDEKGRFKK